MAGEPVHVVAYTLIATVLSVIVPGTMTAAFVLVTWLFLLPGQNFK